MPKIKVNCAYCGKDIERYPSQCLNTVFCSKECMINFKRENNTVLFKCDYCGKEKRIKKSNYKEKSNHFCSRECKDTWQKEGLKGENNPFYNKKHNKITKIKISNSTKGKYKTEENPRYKREKVVCAYCGKVMYKIPYLIKRNKKIFCSRECDGKWKSENLIGPNSPAWNPELTKEERLIKRKYPKYYDFVKSVMKRDNYTCDICKKRGIQFNVHHLNSYDWDKENRINIDNGITLCKKCHKKFHHIYGYGHNTKKQYKEFKEGFK